MGTSSVLIPLRVNCLFGFDARGVTCLGPMCLNPSQGQLPLRILKFVFFSLDIQGLNPSQGQLPLRMCRPAADRRQPLQS